MFFRNHLFHIIVFLLYFLNIYAKLTTDNSLRTLNRWVSFTEPLVTWHTLNTCDNLIRHNTSIDSRKNNSLKIEHLTNTMNDRVRNLTCTYAYYAQRHLEELYTIVDNDLLIDEIIITVSTINSSYLNIALKMLTTISDVGYDPPEWMFKIIPFLQKDWMENLHEDLAVLLNTLIVFNSNYNCNVPKLKPTEKRNINIMLSFDSENEEILTIDLIKEIYSLNTMTEDDFLKKYKIPECITKKYFPYKFSSQQIPGKHSNSSRICGTYLYSQLKGIAENVQNNILDSYYILDKNKSILPFKNYRDFHRPRFIKPSNLNEIDMKMSQEIETNSETKQIFKFKSLINSVVFNTIWYPLGMDKLVELNKQLTNVNNSTKLDRSFLSRLKYTKNSIMDKLHMLYLHYALVHLNQALLFLQYIQLTPGKKRNYDYSQYLIQLYYDISLMTIATFTNNNYYPAEWMVHLVLYCMEENHDIKQTDIIDKKINLSIYNIKSLISLLEEVNSKINPMKLKPPYFDIEGMQFDNNNRTDKLYINLLREYKLLEVQDFIMMPHVDVLYSNLVEVAYLLEFNSKHLSYTNYEKFAPLKWLFKERHLNKNLVNIFYWESVEKESLSNSKYPADDKIWNIFRMQFLYSISLGIKNFKNRPYDPEKIIDKSILVHSYIINLLQLNLLRGILIILSQCHNINQFYIAKKTDSKNNHFLFSYNLSCGFSLKLTQSIQKLLEYTELNTDPLFIQLLEEIKLFPKIYNDVSKSYSKINEIANNPDRITSFTNFLKLGMKKLNEISISMRLEGNDPIIPFSTNTHTMKNINDNLAANVPFLHRSELYIKDLQNIIIRFNNVYKNDFHIHNLLVKSLGHYRPRQISLGYNDENIHF
ncbi:Hypothetical protein CINCED_3A000854 [Cinara cedri]|uniref:Uncharacterized protein n=1 Tax=Cinara cedri TaxID=506608 RepID=A0A5E4NSQ6_9HEMI|nr:Hypothetical protein CINCED_3A000854 [Cinara cedri]